MKNPSGLSHSERIRMAFSGWELNYKGFLSNSRGEWLLLGQLLLISAHFLAPIPSRKGLPYEWQFLLVFTGVGLFIIGIIFCLNSFYHIAPSLSPLPEPKTGAALITNGAYKKCRHPLYQALLLCSLATAIGLASFLHLCLSLALAALLIRKAKREELHLKKIHKEYEHYLANTPAIFLGIPLLDWRT